MAGNLMPLNWVLKLLKESNVGVARGSDDPPPVGYPGADELNLEGNKTLHLQSEVTLMIVIVFHF